MGTSFSLRHLHLSTLVSTETLIDRFSLPFAVAAGRFQSIGRRVGKCEKGISVSQDDQIIRNSVVEYAIR